MSEEAPRQVARRLGLPVITSRKHRPVAAPSWDLLLDWAVEAYWARRNARLEGARDDAA